MIRLSTQKDVASARNLEFCYLCGQTFEGGKRNIPDHLPPKTAFHLDDRNFPIKVACHSECNGGNSDIDLRIGQLFLPVHNRIPSEAGDLVLEVEPLEFSGGGESVGVLSGIDLSDQVWSWVRGFHAALYSEYLPAESLHEIHSALPPLFVDGQNLVLARESTRQVKLTRSIAGHLINDRFDSIRSNNGKLNYVCFWMPSRDGMCECAFALDINSWHELGDVRLGRRRCVGKYAMQRLAPPENAAVEIAIPFSVSMEDLDSAWENLLEG